MLSSCSPMALLWPACVRLVAQLPLCSLDCAAEKRPSELQASRRLSWRCHRHHNPATPSLSLSLTHTHSQLPSQTRATYSSTLVMPWCFLYHVCQWTISLWAFWLQPLRTWQEEKSVSQLRATLTTFTHADSELLCWVKYELKWLFHFPLANSNCCILACNIPFGFRVSYSPMSFSHSVYGMWTHMLSICRASSQKRKRFSTAIILDSLTKSSRAERG